MNNKKTSNVWGFLSLLSITTGLLILVAGSALIDEDVGYAEAAEPVFATKRALGSDFTLYIEE